MKGDVVIGTNAIRNVLSFYAGAQITQLRVIVPCDGAVIGRAVLTGGIFAALIRRRLGSSKESAGKKRL